MDIHYLGNIIRNELFSLAETDSDSDYLGKLINRVLL